MEQIVRKVVNLVISLLTVMYVILCIAGIFTGGLFLISEAVQMGIGYLLYKNNKKIQKYSFWSCWMVVSFICFVAGALAIIIGPAGIVLAVIIRFAILYCY